MDVAKDVHERAHALRDVPQQVHATRAVAARPALVAVAWAARNNAHRTQHGFSGPILTNRRQTHPAAARAS